MANKIWTTYNDMFPCHMNTSLPLQPKHCNDILYMLTLNMLDLTIYNAKHISIFLLNMHKHTHDQKHFSLHMGKFKPHLKTIWCINKNKITHKTHTQSQKGKGDSTLQRWISFLLQEGNNVIIQNSKKVELVHNKVHLKVLTQDWNNNNGPQTYLCVFFLKLICVWFFEWKKLYHYFSCFESVFSCIVVLLQ